MTWADYVAFTVAHLTVDADRRGLEDFRNRMIRNSVVDLQRFIRAYRSGHTTTYLAANLSQKEYGMVGNLPAGAVPEAFYIVSTALGTDGVTHENCARNRLDFWPWINRKHLLCNPCDRRLYAYSIAPYGRMFVIHPILNSETYLLLVWEGLKMDFADPDTVPFPEEAAEASAAYVKWRILLEVDKNPALAQAQLQIWSMKRLALYRDEQEKQDAEKPDDEYDSSIAPIPAPLPVSGVDPYVTSEALLAAVVTVDVAVPLVKVWVDAGTGTTQVWRLLSGTGVAMPGAVVIPNDYIAGDPKTWYKAG